MALKEDLARAVGLRQTSEFHEVDVSYQDIMIDASPDETRTLSHIRVGLGLTLLYETAHLFSARWISKAPAMFYCLVLLDMVVTSLAFALTRSAWCRRRWRELVFFECSVMVIINYSNFTG